jgi:hypothetical protein
MPASAHLIGGWTALDRLQKPAGRMVVRPVSMPEMAGGKSLADSASVAEVPDGDRDGAGCTGPLEATRRLPRADLVIVVQRTTWSGACCAPVRAIAVG